MYSSFLVNCNVEVHCSHGFFQCNPEKDWIIIRNGTFHISAEAIQNHGEIKCDVSPYGWEDDYSVRYLLSVALFY